MTSNTTLDQLLSDVNDVLGQLQTMLACASIDERIAINNAARLIYPNPATDPYQTLTTTINQLLYSSGFRERAASTKPCPIMV